VNSDEPMDRMTDLRIGWKNRPSQTGHSVFRKSGFVRMSGCHTSIFRTEDDYDRVWRSYRLSAISLL